ncbi:MAG: cation-translocating P-type ATPase [Anaerolineae bacterium]
MSETTQIEEEQAPRPIQALLIPEVYTATDSRPEGLTGAQVTERLGRYGANVIREVKGVPLWRKLLANFTHLMALLLWVGGAVAFIAQLPQLGIAIWLVNVINGIFSFWQEFRAERATEALRELLPTYVRVMREAQEARVLAQDLVPGDVMILGEGDAIPADARIVSASELRVDQSTLTGESRPVLKTAEAVYRTDLGAAEMPNLVFAGTAVAAGAGHALVFATGMETQFGKIANLTQSVGSDLSPLQRELGRVTRTISFLVLGIGVLFFVLSVLLAGLGPVEGFVFAMGMIVAFVPEGMLPTVTLSLAMGVQRMAKRHALIKKLSAVETLGSTTVICTDKTGTLTQNEMTVTEVWVAGHRLTVSGVGYDPAGQVLEDGRPVASPSAGDLRELLVAGALCNNARVLPPNEAGRITILGDPTEAALTVAATKAGLDMAAVQRGQPRLRELPFESRRKRMTTIHDQGETYTAYTKGAPREVLDLCTRILVDSHEEPLDDARRAEIVAANDDLARRGLRVLAMARRSLPEVCDRSRTLSECTTDYVEGGLTFLGLEAMMDPPRPEVAEAVERCYRAGIRIIMITGDYGLTAESIARRIGIVRGPRPRVISGMDLEGMDDQALAQALQEEVLFARVAPEHKLRVVSALQALGHVAAVTGDGVNDAPALKKADIGVAMGMAGTDVAKEAADMVLTDDNFASVVNAVEEGRAVYSNIRKFIMYVFNSNMAEAAPIIVSLFSGGLIPLPLTVMQVLAIDLGTDMVPAVGLGSERPEPGIMDRPPRSQAEPLITRRLLTRAMLWYGLIEAVAGLAGYFFLNWLRGWPGEPLAAVGTPAYLAATTLTLGCIVAAQAGAVQGCRTDRISVFRKGLLSNRLVVIGIVVEFLVVALLAYTPVLQHVFGTAPLEPQHWLFMLLWAPVLFLLDELRKALLRLRERRTRGGA